MKYLLHFLVIAKYILYLPFLYLYIILKEFTKWIIYYISQNYTILHMYLQVLLFSLLQTLYKVYSLQRLLN